MNKLWLCIVLTHALHNFQAQNRDSIFESLITMPAQKDEIRYIQQKKNKAIYNNSKQDQQEYIQEFINTKGNFISNSEMNLVPQAASSKALVKSKAELTSIIIAPAEEYKKLKGPTDFDSRIEVRNLDLKDPDEKRIFNNTLAVGMLIEKEMIHQINDTLYQLDVSSTLGSLYRLCPEEPFYKQPVCGIGTAFAVDSQIMITASHVFTKSIENYLVVFGFEMVNKVGAYQGFIHVKDLYYPKSIAYISDEKDVMAFHIDRALDRPFLKFNVSDTLKEGAAVYMIGHPMGLPKKIAVNADILDSRNPVFFYTSLDAFQGNSGSPVFLFDTHEVIGILVSGELDYKWTGNCNTSTLCSFPYCKGEKVIRIKDIMTELNTD